MAVIIIFAVICLAMICSILFFPTVKIKGVSLDTYWIITLCGAGIMLLAGNCNVTDILSELVADSAINPVKILVLFISMTALSIFLDELGFFSYLAGVTLKRAKANQKKLFLYLYITVSILTVFTSNDIIILSFTPFICYFAKHAKISPIPYLAAEFVAANTWSMALIIGNPTNIYLCSAFGITFVRYLSVMILPTLVSGTVAFIMLYLVFGRYLQSEMKGESSECAIKDKKMLAVGLLHLLVCTAALAVSSYVGIEMWKVSLACAVSLFAFVLAISASRKRKPAELINTVKRLPYQLIPFVLSMFTMIIILTQQGITEEISRLIGESYAVYKYGILSFISDNVINNIPMSVLFCSVINNLPGELQTGAVYATVVGSNLGALLTPIGALAGIMWSSILSGHNLKYGYIDFIKTGVAVGIPALLSCLVILSLTI